MEKIAALGYDYIELPLAEMMELSQEEFNALKERVARSGIRCEACNNFFPSKIRLTGPDVDMDLIQDYIVRSLARAGELGVSVVVFGSAGAKRVPDGFSMAEAFRQVVEVTRRAGLEAMKHGITIAIEPVRLPDCNIINTFEEGVTLAATVDLDSVKVLVDYYHMVCQHESEKILLRFGKEYLRHVHFSYPNFPTIDGATGPDPIRGVFEGELAKKGWWRTYPSNGEEWDYTAFIAALKGAGYDGRVSLEAPVTDFDAQAKKALEFLKAAF